MSETEEKPDLEQIVDEVKEYVETRSKISKLKAIDQGSKMAGSMVSGFIIVLIVLGLIAFLSVSAAFALSEWIGRAYSGFLIVAGFYFVLLILLALYKKRWIENPVTNAFIRNFFNNPNE